MNSVLFAKVCAIALLKNILASQGDSTKCSAQDISCNDVDVDTDAEDHSLLQVKLTTESEVEDSQGLKRVAESSNGADLECHLKNLKASPHPPKSFKQFDQGSDYQGLYAHKKANFAFCLIEKNACSQWATILNKLETNNLDAKLNYSLVSKTWSADKAAEVFQDNSSTRAVFVRDPLERFLSAYLDKCTNLDCKNSYCFMRMDTPQGQGIPFSQAVEWLGYVNTARLDGHFKLQSRHCELHERVDEYTTLGVMSSDTLAEDATCLLDQAGLSYLNVQSSKANAPAFWQVPEVKEGTMKTEDWLKSFYTKEAAEAVYKAYEEDYKVFKLPKPRWIYHAHGKLYKEAEAKPCHVGALQVGSNEAYVSSDDSMDEDDIPTLAQRAGFKL